MNQPVPLVSVERVADTRAFEYLLNEFEAETIVHGAHRESRRTEVINYVGALLAQINRNKAA